MFVMLIILVTLNIQVIATMTHEMALGVGDVGDGGGCLVHSAHP